MLIVLYDACLTPIAVFATFYCYHITVQNKKVERYDNALQSRYKDLQNSLILDNAFLGSLLFNHVITDLEHAQLQVSIFYFFLNLRLGIAGYRPGYSEILGSW